MAKKYSTNSSYTQEFIDLPVVVILGANGFAGRHLVHKLLMKGDVAVRILKKNSSREKFHPNLTVVQGDLSKPETLKGLLVTNCIVINLAFAYDMTNKYNLLITKNLTDICRSVRIKRMIHCSTVSVYGFSGKDIDEDSICNPLSQYGKTKLLIEKILTDNAKGNYKLVILRPTCIFGPHGNALVKMFERLNNSNKIYNYLRSCILGNRNLNIVSINFVITAIIFCMNEKLDIDGKIFNLSQDCVNGNNYSYVEKFFLEKKYYSIQPFKINKLFLDLALKFLKLNYAIGNIVYHSKKISSFGFNCPETFDQSLLEYIKWYKRNIK